MVRSGSRVLPWVAWLLLVFPVTATGKICRQSLPRWELQGCWEDLGGGDKREAETRRGGQPARLGRKPSVLRNGRGCTHHLWAEPLPLQSCVISRASLQRPCSSLCFQGTQNLINQQAQP